MNLSKEKRSDNRVKDNVVSVEIPLSIPKNYKLNFQVCDMSDSGFSFLIPTEEGTFPEDTIIPNIKIYNKDNEIFIDKARVVYHVDNYIVSEIATYHKIGVEFLCNENGKKQKIRHKRFTADMLGTVKGKVSLKDSNGEIYDGKLLDFSLYGVSISIRKTNLIPKMSDIIELKITIGDKSVYDGEGIVKNFQEGKDLIILRINLTTNIFGVDKFLGLRTNERVKDEEKFIENIFRNIKDISYEYKSIVGDISYILSSVKKRFDAFEKELPKDNEKTRDILIKNMFESMAKNIFPMITDKSNKLDEIANNLTQNEHEIYKDYYQRMLHSFLMGAKLTNRVYNKPLGFPGDYEMMNIISRNSMEGVSLFDKFINTYFCSIPLSQSNRNRSEYLYGKIKDYQNKFLKQDEGLKITSIACGSAIEIQKYISRDILSNNAFITLLDFEKEALDYSHKKLEHIISDNNRNTNLKFIEDSIFTLMKNKTSLDKIDDNQDIIYSIGLFEYLSISICQKLIATLYNKVKKGGLMILGNYAKGSPDKAVMELGLEWYLIYRDNNELLTLADGIKNDKNVYVENEPLGLIKFLIIEK